MKLLLSLIYYCCSIIHVSIYKKFQSIPLIGAGNELVWQNVSDSNLIKATNELHSNIGRYPGGTPSDYWNWTIGWATDVSPNSTIFYTPPKVWHQWINHTSLSNSILVVNQLTDSLEYAIQGLWEHKRRGTIIKYIELGNEMYTTTRKDVLEKYPKPKDYAIAMSKWTIAIKKVFPEAKIALIGNRWDPPPSTKRENRWNYEVLQNKISYYADAATIHIYCNLNGGIYDIKDANKFLQGAFMYVKNNRKYFKKTIPKHFEIWITELGTYSMGSMNNTWLFGLYHAILITKLATIPRVNIIIPYCLVCGADSASLLTTNNGSIPYNPNSNLIWKQTVKGKIFSLITNVLYKKTDKLNMEYFGNQLQFDNIETIIGWKYRNQYLLLNTEQRYYELELNINSNLINIYKIYPKHIEDVLNKSIGWEGLIETNQTHKVLFTNIILKIYPFEICIITELE